MQVAFLFNGNSAFAVGRICAVRGGFYAGSSRSLTIYTIYSPLLAPDQLLLSFPAREVDLQLYRPHAVGVLSTDSYGDDHYKYIEQARLIPMLYLL